MTEPADLILRGGAVHPLIGTDPVEAVAIRDGAIVYLGSTYEVSFLDGVTTTAIDLDGRTVLPGFIDTHTHLELVGRREVEADLVGMDSPAACLDELRERAAETDGWVLGFGYDESVWNGEYLTRDQLDTVSTDRPVAAFREDMHVASVNGVVLDRLGDQLPGENVRTEGGESTGVLVEEAVSVLNDMIRPDGEQMERYLRAAQRVANRRGVTTVHEMVRHSHAPRVYRDLDRADELTLRVRLNYWADHLDAVQETGLCTNHGSELVRVGAIKTFVDGSIGGRTARLSEPYADSTPETDANDDAGTNRGEWVTAPDELAVLVERVENAGLQFAAHAIGDEAIVATLDALEGTNSRHRIEHAEVLTDELVERLATANVVVSAQPNFLRWAEKDGLYDRRLGENRRRHSNRFRELYDAGAQLAFGSDCMPLSPLFGIDRAVNAPGPAQRLSVTEAIEAYTAGGAYAGYDEHRLGTIEVGKRGDLVVLDASPWESESIADIDVATTVVDGAVVYDAR